jgi:hypothetical protein
MPHCGSISATPPIVLISGASLSSKRTPTSFRSSTAARTSATANPIRVCPREGEPLVVLQLWCIAHKGRL